jgi:AraC family transcriptional regulator, positive regulator of tynA and feaB
LASIHRISTANVPAEQRLAFWNDLCANAYRPMVVDAERDGFKGVLTRLDADDLQIISANSTPLVTRSSPSGPTLRGDETIFSLQLVHRGRCRIRHGSIETFAEAGDMIVADGSKRYELAFAEPVHGLVLSLPWDRFRGYADALEAHAGRTINVNKGSGAVLSSFIRSAWNELVEREGEEWPESAAEVIWNLLASVLQGDTEREIGVRRADDLRRAARALVDRELGDAGFRSSAIAGSLGVSARYVQVVFAEVGTTPSRFLLTRRLEAAAARLRRPGNRCSITEVALECGFSDLSYFSRAFRRRFGVPASAYRSRFGAAPEDWR